MPKTLGKNPFYILLVGLGIVFGMTACAYVVMTFQLSTVAGRVTHGEAPLFRFLNDYGLWLLGGEIASLAIVSFIAISTDGYWTNREE